MLLSRIYLCLILSWIIRGKYSSQLPLLSEFIFYMSVIVPSHGKSLANSIIIHSSCSEMLMQYYSHQDYFYINNLCIFLELYIVSINLHRDLIFAHTSIYTIYIPYIYPIITIYLLKISWDGKCLCSRMILCQGSGAECDFTEACISWGARSFQNLSSISVLAFKKALFALFF